MNEVKTDEIDDAMNDDPEFLEFWAYVMNQTNLTGLKRIAFVSWNAGWDNGYEFSESINKALKEIDFRAGSVNLTSE